MKILPVLGDKSLCLTLNISTESLAMAQLLTQYNYPTSCRLADKLGSHLTRTGIQSAATMITLSMIILLAYLEV